MNYEKELKEYLDIQTMTPNTKRGYISSFNSLQKLFKTDNIDYIKNSKTTIKEIEEAYPKPNVISTKINTILLLFKVFYPDSNKEYEKYKKEFLKYRKNIITIIKEGYEAHEATETQKEKMRTMFERLLMIPIPGMDEEEQEELL
jgi:hypothetical protein